jgi:hypothetical protein
VAERVQIKARLGWREFMCDADGGHGVHGSEHAREVSEVRRRKLQRRATLQTLVVQERGHTRAHVTVVHETNHHQRPTLGLRETTRLLRGHTTAADDRKSLLLKDETEW